MNFELIIGLSFLNAISAYVYCEILCENGNILSPWYKFLNQKIGYMRGDGCSQTEPINWIWKPLIGCVRCVCGNMALWAYLIVNLDNWNWYEHLMVIFVSIFFVDGILILWKKLMRVR